MSSNPSGPASAKLEARIERLERQLVELRASHDSLHSRFNERFPEPEYSTNCPSCGRRISVGIKRCPFCHELPKP